MSPRPQNQIVNADRPPELKPTVIPKEDLRARFGAAAEEMIEQSEPKALDDAAVEMLNQRLAKEWTTIAERLKAVMLPYERLREAMASAGCQLDRFGSRPRPGILPRRRSLFPLYPRSFFDARCGWRQRSVGRICQDM